MTYLQQLFGASAAGSVNDERLWTAWAGPVTATGLYPCRWVWMR